MAVPILHRAITIRPGSLGQLDRFFAAATIAHEYISDLHRELVALHEDTERTHELLGESAAVVLERMPELTRELRRLGRDWAEQALLEPPQAERALALIEAGLAAVAPELTAIRLRQDDIVAELREGVDHARRS